MVNLKANRNGPRVSSNWIFALNWCLLENMKLEYLPREVGSWITHTSMDDASAANCLLKCLLGYLRFLDWPASHPVDRPCRSGAQLPNVTTSPSKQDLRPAGGSWRSDFPKIVLYFRCQFAQIDYIIIGSPARSHLHSEFPNIQKHLRLILAPDFPGCPSEIPLWLFDFHLRWAPLELAAVTVLCFGYINLRYFHWSRELLLQDGVVQIPCNHHLHSLVRVWPFHPLSHFVLARRLAILWRRLLYAMRLPPFFFLSAHPSSQAHWVFSFPRLCHYRTNSIRWFFLSQKCFIFHQQLSSSNCSIAILRVHPETPGHAIYHHDCPQLPAGHGSCWP